MKSQSEHKKGAIFCYIITVCVSSFSSTYLEFVMNLFGGSRADDTYTAIFRPLLSITGNIVGGALMQYGRRRMLLLFNIFELLIILMAASWSSVLLAYILRFAMSLACGFVYVATMIYAQEIPPLVYLGSSLSIYYGMTRMGNFIGSTMTLIVKLTKTSLEESSNYGYRILWLSLAAIPQIVQLILILAKYQVETPPFLVEHSSVEEAVVSVNALYKTRESALLQVAKMERIAEFKKYTRVTWSTLVSQQYRKATLLGFCFLAMRGLTGMYEWQITAGILLPQKWATPFSVCQEGLGTIYSFICIFYIDVIDISYLMSRGFFILGIVNVANLGVSALWFINPFYHVFSSALSSCLYGITVLYITIAGYKLVAMMLPDKGVAIAMVGSWLGFSVFTIRNVFIDRCHMTPIQFKMMEMIYSTIYATCAFVSFLITKWLFSKDGKLLKDSQLRDVLFPSQHEEESVPTYSLNTLSNQ